MFPGRTRTLIVALALMLPAASAAPAHAALPPQGVYDACGPGTDGGAACIGRLDRASAAGFKLVLNYTLWYANAAQIREYLDAAHARGLQVIVPFNARAWRDGSDLKRHYRFLAPGCGCSGNDDILRYAMEQVKHHPATWGYYVGDEVNPNEVGLVKALSDKVHALDPSRPRFYVSLENHEAPGANLAPFKDVADVLASDSYPIGWGGPPETVGAIAQAVRNLIGGTPKRSAFVVQAFSWEMYPTIGAPEPRWPTVDEMRRMRDAAIEHASPAFLLWYSMHDILESADPERHWADLAAAAFAPDPRDKPAEPPKLEELRVSRRIANQRTTKARLYRSLRRCRKVEAAARSETCRERAWRHYKRGLAVRWELSAPGTIEVTVSRLDRRRGRRVEGSRWREEQLGTATEDAPAGSGALRLWGKLARRAREPGRYRIRVVVRSEAGEVTAKPRTMRVPDSR